MRLYALVGASGTGKSHHATLVTQKYHIECILDDGLLISNGKILAGTSAKKESTKIASVKHAIFFDDDYASEMRNIIKKHNIKSLLILGTSEKMVNQIASRLGLPEVSEIIHIEDIATPEEIKLAINMRTKQGKHVIPVPTVELKQDFSGYFLHSLRIFQKKNSTGEITHFDKSIIRPTYSYLGNFNISDNAISQIISYETGKIKSVAKLHSIKIEKLVQGIGVDMIISVYYGACIHDACHSIKDSIAYHIENYTSINVEHINITVRGIILS